MMKNRVLPTVIVGLVGAIIGSFLMLLYASSHLGGQATGSANGVPPPVSAAPLAGGGSDQERIVTAVKRTKASVVAITESINGQQVVPIDPAFGPQGPGYTQRYRGEASGSGFIYDTQGDIVTNAHVVTAPQGGRISNLTVTFADGTHMPAHVIASNIASDLAVIKVDNYSKLPPPLQLADSDRLEQGQWAIAIGEPYELQQTVTLGIVSGFNREEQAAEGNVAYDFKGLLQTSAPINPGNSGGPLIDIEGQVIGVNQLTNRAAQGIGFAIPANTVKRIIPDLIAHPGVHQGTDVGFVGIRMANLSEGLKNQIGYTGSDGVAITEVVSGTAADQAGLQAGDVILSVDGKSYNNYTDLHNYIGTKHPGDTLRMQIWSQGVKRLVPVKIGEMPAGQAIQGGP